MQSIKNMHSDVVCFQHYLVLNNFKTLQNNEILFCFFSLYNESLNTINAQTRMDGGNHQFYTRTR